MVVLQRQKTATELAVCVGVLLCLGAVAGWVLLTQRNFNPAVRVSPTPDPPLGVRSASEPASVHPGPVANQGLNAGDFAAFAPAGVTPFGPLEQFDEETLSDKINGKADLYLTSGFKQLRCQRFAVGDGEEDWFEFFVYDMGTLPQAFAVYSVQRRPECKPLELTEFAYATKNALYFVCGPFYVEVVAAQPSEQLQKAMLDMASRFVAATPAGPMRLVELELFPPENKVPYSETLNISSAFGFEGFSNVFTVKYEADGKHVLAYLTALDDEGKAAALAHAYCRFLLANGAEEIPPERALENGKVFSLLGTYEVVVQVGRVVGGVHAAHSQHAGEQVARALATHVAGRHIGAQRN
ncbi:MAG: hypothetical protein NZ739_00690 [Verrucomicrobiae bacterium]|nr:hypothetical protein [Verrucomicrobiae bacterium]MDW7979150.1 DUF6599 family protein [Verrucomicrobiales bacterium]